MIWLVGARGMLGQDVADRLNVLVIPHLDSDLECDITEKAALLRFVDGRRFDWIVNCSAYTAVDKAEDEEPKADAVNATGPANIGSVAAGLGARLIHLSTDYVFDGKASSPYTEEQPPAPRGAYGRTKARGESLLSEALAEHFIVRTAWLYGVRGKNFVSTMIRLMNEREEVFVVNDQRGTPTYTRDLAAALCAIVTADSRAYGIYHYTNEGETTWFDFARLIYETGRARGHIRHSCEVHPISTDRYPTKAIRPGYSVLSKAKIRNAFRIAIPTWQNGLERFFEELEQEKST